MIAIITSAILHVTRFHRGELSAVQLEQALLDEGWSDITFQKRNVWGKYLGISYLLEE